MPKKKWSSRLVADLVASSAKESAINVKDSAPAGSRATSTSELGQLPMNEDLVS